MFVRSKRINGRQYYYLVKSVRKNGAVHQQYLEYLGPKVPSSRKMAQLIKEYSK